MSTSPRVGIDLGGTKIEVVGLAPDGTERHRARVPTPVAYEAVIEAIAALVAEADRVLGTAATVGVGIPGHINPKTGTVRNANQTALMGNPLDLDLASRLRRPVRVANDANCFALSEAVDGAGAGQKVVAGVILGTGCGMGIVLDGVPLEGANRFAGDIGHTSMPWPSAAERAGPRCYCGRLGCVEAFVSGSGLRADYVGALSLRDDLGPTGAEIAARAAAGEERARRALERHTERLARVCAAIISLVDPNVIVLGGGASNLEHLYDEVPKLWGPFIDTEIGATRLVKARHGDSGGVRGAAWLWGT